MISGTTPYLQIVTSSTAAYGSGGTSYCNPISSTSNIVYNYNTSTSLLYYKYDYEEELDMFPFKLKIKREIIYNGYLIIKIEWKYEVYCEGKYHCHLFSYKSDRLTNEEISIYLENDSKIWLEKQMKSTMKMNSISS